MAVKNTKAKMYKLPCDDICAILRSPEFSKCMDATFFEEAILADGVEFRYKRETTMARYGRNYFIKVKKAGENETEVAVTTQSRKVTVLFDTQWKREVEQAFVYMDVLLRK